ncbi:MAG: hypothetical protein RL417_1495 [Pseudomonadota bacterium]|jgi:drug/metabolite transporter (DMT)-like permease
MLGISAALLSAVCATAKDIVSKRLSREVSGSVSAFASFLFALPFYLVLLAALYLLGVEDFAVSGAFFTFIVLRGLSDTAAEWMKMQALAVSDLSFVACFLALSPVFLIVTSPFLTGEPITRSEMAALALVCCGTVLAAYKPGETLAKADKKGMVWGVGAAFFFSVNTCFDKLAVQTASPTVSAFAVTVVAGLFLMPAVWRTPGGVAELRRFRSPFFLRGFFELLFMVTKLTALLFLSAPAVMALQRVSLILNVVSGRTLFHEGQFGRRLGAAILILCGIILVIFDRG